ncbi:MAG: TlpA disulfide reductase family protein [Spirochaetota bacterium]
MKKIKYCAVYGMVLFLLVAAGALSLAAQDKDYFSELGIYSPSEEIIPYDFTAESITGKRVSLSEFKGKVVFLNFWATWCPPCKSEIKDIQTLYTTLKDEKFTVMAVDVQEGAQTVRSFMKDMKADFPVYLDPEGEIAMRYQIRGLPTTFLLGADGKIAGMAVGPRQWGSETSIKLMRSLMEK